MPFAFSSIGMPSAISLKLNPDAEQNGFPIAFSPRFEPATI